jgi:uncharacterized membrane protein YhfC
MASLVLVYEYVHVDTLQLNNICCIYTPHHMYYVYYGTHTV